MNDHETTEITETTALVHIRPGADTSIIALYQESLGILARAEARVIALPEDLKPATDDLSVIAGVKNEVEARRKEYVDPLNAYLHIINSAFKDYLAPLTKADVITRQKVQGYLSEQKRIRLEQERINRLKQEAAEAEMRLNGELSEPVGLVEVQAPTPSRVVTDVGTLGTATEWKFEVFDFALLPDEYKLPDMVKIRKVVVAKVAIPGIRAWQEEVLRVTARRTP